MKTRLLCIVAVAVGLVFLFARVNTALTSNDLPSSPELPSEDKLRLFFVAITNSDMMYAFPMLDGTVGTGHLIGVGRAAGVADFDNDGFYEVLAVREEDRLLRLYENDGGSGFTRQVVSDDAYPSSFTLHPSHIDSAVGDFDDNSLVDFAFTVHRSIQVHLNHGDGQFERRSIDVDAAWGRMCGLDSGDFNADDYVDLAAQRYRCDPDNVTHLLLGNGDGTFSDSQVFTTANPNGTPGVTGGDFNSDGYLDLVVGQDDGGDAGQTWLHIGDGTGAFTYYGPAYDTNPAVEHAGSAPGDGHPGTYDVDGDGNLDIVSPAEGIGLLLFKGNGDGSFQPPVTLDTGSNWFWVAAPAYLPTLRMTKHAHPTKLRTGEQLTYTLSVTNTGSVALHTTITDTLPAQVSPTGVLTWTPTITAPGGRWMQQLVVTVALGYVGPLTNTIEVTTEEGVSASDSCVVVAEEPIAGLAATNDAPTPLGSPTTLTATITAGSNVSYTWNLGDGKTDSGAVVSHAYPHIGVYTATVTAANSVSVESTTSLVTVTDAPIAGLTAVNDSPTLLGHPTILTATVTAGSNVSYTWDFGDGGVGRGGTVSHVYPAIGTYTAVVTASNSVSVMADSSSVSIDFALYLPLVMKRWPPLPYQPTLYSIDNPDGDGSYYVSWTERPSRLADTYILQEATDSTFSSDVREVCTTASQSCHVTDRSAGTYYYRVRGHNAWGHGQYSGVQSVIVLPPVTPTIEPIANDDGDGAYTVAWNATARATWYQLLEDTDPGFGSPQTVHEGAANSWQATDKTAGTYYYRVRALGPTGRSEWSGTQTVAVLLPEVPTLRPIDNADGDGSYIVTWNAALRADNYVLQEDMDPVFTSPTQVYEGPGMSWNGNATSTGMHYYRVRSRGPTGHSAWSSIEAVTVVATPYNPSAQSLVLSLSDMPYGYTLEEDESGPLEISGRLKDMGAVEGYEVEYSNWDLLFSDTPLVYNLAVVFDTPEGAHSYIVMVDSNFRDSPEYTPISCPALGNETVAFRGITEDDGIEVVTYAIAFRRDNLAAAVITGGLPGAATFDTALSFAQQVLNKINSCISGTVTSGNATGFRDRTVANLAATTWSNARGFAVTRASRAAMHSGYDLLKAP